MACALTQGYSLDCRDSVGGIKTMYIIELDNVNSVAVASGVVTGITKATGKRFWKYNLEHNTSSATAEFAGSRENGTGFWTQTVAIILNKMQAALRNEIKLIAQNRLVAVIVDKNDAAWLYGRVNGLMMASGNSATGTAMGDRNGYTINLVGEEKEDCDPVNSSVVTTLETPGA